MFALFLGATATTTALTCNFTVLLKIWLLRAVSIPPMFLNWSKNPVSLGLKENQFIANGQTPCKFSSVATTKSCCHRCICVIFLFTFLCRHITMTGNLNIVHKLISPHARMYLQCFGTIWVYLDTAVLQPIISQLWLQLKLIGSCEPISCQHTRASAIYNTTTELVTWLPAATSSSPL